MGKYIDAEKLKAQIVKLYDEDYKFLPTDIVENIQDFKDDIIILLDSLQQEQPSEDLESEIEKYFQGLWPGMKTTEQCNTDMHFTPPAIMRLASHFYELGQSAMRKRFTDPEYNQRVIEKMKFEYPANESNARKEE